MEMHALLKRQLDRLQLDKDSLPIDLAKWGELLDRINNAYMDADQERYLLERSMEISSKELLTLNEKLEGAQHTARLGYWHYEPQTGKIIWSKELYNMLGFSNGGVVKNFEQLLELIHDEDRSRFVELVDDALSSNHIYEHEMRIRDHQGKYNWYYVTGHSMPSIEGTPMLSSIAMDITKHKKDEQQITLLNQQLLNSARSVGMADVATFILHNVGNILNSANVSIGLLNETLKKKHFEKLFAVAKLIKENLSSIDDYLTKNEKGKLVPQYVVTLADILENEYIIFNNETESLTKNLEHIKEIVASQKVLSGVSGFSEKVFLPEIIDNALQMSTLSAKNSPIKIKKNFKDNLFIITDKSKLIQILVNILQNAKDSLTSHKVENKEIDIFLKKREGADLAEIIIEDNGVGIESENLTKIFSFGFTTKIKGHGFGLHSSALAAKEMGGELQAYSDGLGRGAKFILFLPITQERKENE